MINSDVGKSSDERKECACGKQRNDYAVCKDTVLCERL